MAHDERSAIEMDKCSTVQSMTLPMFKAKIHMPEGANIYPVIDIPAQNGEGYSGPILQWFDTSNGFKYSVNEPLWYVASVFVAGW